ncbi:MAG: hypothetical protein IPI49_02110 [Myxococcales bacterium]|nr:hypothetical protein [Myxococcales bacterium]
MRRAILATALASIACLVYAASPAAAAPAAGLVVVWAPGATEALAPALAQARRAGAAVIDTTPSVLPEAADLAALRAGQTAYDNLRFDDAVAALGRAAQSVELTGGAGLSQRQLSDVFLYRALAAVALGTPEAAWDDFVRAAVVAPSRELDPAQFAPRAIEQLERARGHVAALPRIRVRLLREPGCVVSLDGAVTAEPEVALVRGHHYLVAACPGRRAAQRGFDVVEEAELGLVGAPLPAPSDDAALVQGRTLGVPAVLIITASANAVLMRRLGIEGREQARSAVPLGAAGSDRALGQELARLLRSPSPVAPWYRSRWAWAAAGVLAASAVLVPLVLQNNDPPTVVIRPEGAPW